MIAAAAVGFWARDRLQSLAPSLPGIKAHAWTPGGVIKLSVRVHGAACSGLCAPGVFKARRPYLILTIGDKTKQTELGDWCESSGQWRFDETLTFAVCLAQPPTLKIQLRCRTSADLGVLSISLPDEALGETVVDLMTQASQHFQRCTIDPARAGHHGDNGLELWETARLRYPQGPGDADRGAVQTSSFCVEVSFAVHVQPGDRSSMLALGIPVGEPSGSTSHGSGGDGAPSHPVTSPNVVATFSMDEAREALEEAQEAAGEHFSVACEAVNAAVERLPRLQRAAARVATRRFNEFQNIISELAAGEDEPSHSIRPAEVRPTVPPTPAAPKLVPTGVSLPPGWTQMQLKDGRSFYHHETGMTSWERPTS